MPDNIIHILPPEVSNQIAAGEVVQRPSSVVKELMENAIDAGANRIDVYIKEAGRTLIQVIDDGKGMSANDAITAFQPHATSKIQAATDLFSLSTMGFRGEALASIAAVAHVELRTKQADAELGSAVHFAGGELESQEYIQCPKGTNMAVRDLFYNIPARRKFLKSNETEFRNILSVFEQVTLAYPELEFTLTHNDSPVHHVLPENVHQRILSLFGGKFKQKLLPVELETILGRISGYIATPEAAVKRNAPQFFFVNGRYIQHPYFNKAISMAYEKLLMPGMRAPYFIYFEIDPAKIDVNIHPTKTEVRFEDEKAMFPILSSAIRETLGKASVIPTIDFDQTDAPEIPALHPTEGNRIVQPTVSYDPTYNPFKSTGTGSYHSQPIDKHWEDLYPKSTPKANPFAGADPFAGSSVDLPSINNEDNGAQEQGTLWVAKEPEEISCFQWQQKYIVVPQENGLEFVHQHRAHVRVLYELFLARLEQGERYSTPLLFPEAIEWDWKEDSFFQEMRPNLEQLGFSFEDFGKHTYQITAVPEQVGDQSPVTVLKEIMAHLLDDPTQIQEQIKQRMAQDLAEKTAISAGKFLTTHEMQSLLKQLRACQEPTYSPNGKAISAFVSPQEIENKLK